MDRSPQSSPGPQNPQLESGLSPFSFLPEAQGIFQQEPQVQQQNMLGFAQYASLPASAPSAFLQATMAQDPRQHGDQGQQDALSGFAHPSLPESIPSAYWSELRAWRIQQYAAPPDHSPDLKWLIQLARRGGIPPSMGQAVDNSKTQPSEYVNASEMVDAEDIEYNGEGSQAHPVDLTGGDDDYEGLQADLVDLTGDDDEYEGLQMIELAEHRRVVEALEGRIAELEAQLRAAKRSREATGETVGRSSVGPQGK